MTLTVERARPTRAPVCRRAGCSAPAGDLGLCEGHLLDQKRLRAGVETRPPSSPAPIGPAWLVELAAAREAPWTALAACRGETALMFPESDRRLPADYGPALALCERCPVVEPCRQAGAREHHGVWGGLSPARRRRNRPPAA